MDKEYPSLKMKPMQHIDTRRGLFSRTENEKTVIRCPRSMIILKHFETEIWDMCNGENTIKNIIDFIHEKYEIDRKEIESTLISFLEGLRNRELLFYLD